MITKLGGPSFPFKLDERATLARATRVDIHSILVLEPSALGNSTIFGISVPDYPSRNIERTFLGQFRNLFTFRS